MLDLMKNIPTLLAFYVPGYLAYYIFTRLTRLTKEDGSKPEGSSLIPSIIISYFTTSITVLLKKDQNIDDKFEISLALQIALISAFIAIVLSFFLFFIWETKWFQEAFKQFTGTTVHQSIWDDILVNHEINKTPRKRCFLTQFNHKKEAKRIRIFTEYNHKNAYIEGIVAYYEVDKDGDCRIAIKNCLVKYENDNKYETNGMIVFKAGDIQIIETAN